MEVFYQGYCCISVHYNISKVKTVYSAIPGLTLLNELALSMKFLFSKWFEPRSISSLSSVIVRVSVVLKRTVGDSD